MEIKEELQGNVIVLRPVGRIDNDTSLAFQDQLLKCLDASAAALVDLSGVEFISSAGLAALMTAAKTAKAKSRRIAVAALRPVVQEIFTISRFARVVSVYATTAEGVAALG
ncbi:MAG TPA: STAS domain-containing protein [Stellaceae bacterium]|nr:STAS domain-containing protein [Stellaceae bacterium]